MNAVEQITEKLISEINRLCAQSSANAATRSYALAACADWAANCVSSAQEICANVEVNTQGCVNYVVDRAAIALIRNAKKTLDETRLRNGLGHFARSKNWIEAHERLWKESAAEILERKCAMTDMQTTAHRVLELGKRGISEGEALFGPWKISAGRLGDLCAAPSKFWDGLEEVEPWITREAIRTLPTDRMTKAPQRWKNDLVREWAQTCWNLEVETKDADKVLESWEWRATCPPQSATSALASRKRKTINHDTWAAAVCEENAAMAGEETFGGTGTAGIIACVETIDRQAGQIRKNLHAKLAAAAQTHLELRATGLRKNEPGLREVQIAVGSRRREEAENTVAWFEKRWNESETLSSGPREAWIVERTKGRNHLTSDATWGGQIEWAVSYANAQAFLAGSFGTNPEAEIGRASGLRMSVERASVVKTKERRRGSSEELINEVREIFESLDRHWSTLG